MAPHELVVLALGVSVAGSAAAWGLGLLIERGCDDPRLRDAVWGVGLGLGLLPVLAVSFLLLTPAPIREVAATVAPIVTVETAATAATAAPPAVGGTVLPEGLLAWAILAAAFVAALVRLGGLGLGALRLARLIRKADPADLVLQDRVGALAATLKVRPPRTVISATTSEALLSGFGRPCLVLPALSQPAADAVIAHELAHLKRGDHHTLWLEEAVSIAMAFNPLIPVLRARRDAAREEACDALALSDATPETRRAYALALIDALRSRAAPSGERGPRPALTFTGAGRTTAMHRLKALTTPAAPASRRARLIAAAGSLGLVATIASASWAVAAQRPLETRVAGTTDVALSAPDFAYTVAALNPVYRVAWPTACGFGIENGDRLMVYAGDCATGDGSRIEVLALAGASILPDTRTAFEAVKAACDAGRPVEIAYAENGVQGRASVACAGPAETPAAPVRFTVDMAYEPAIRIAAGDRLEIDLSRYIDEQGGTASTSIVLNLAPGALPGQAFAELRPPLLPADLGAEAPFSLSAKIVAADGTVKAVSDRERGRPFAPFVISEGVITTAVRMLPTEQVAAVPVQASAVSSRRGSSSAALTVQVRQPERTPLIIGSGDRLRLTLSTETGPEAARYATAMDMALSPDQPVSRDAVFTLADDQLPSLTQGRVYELRAVVLTPDDRVAYSADPVTVRMAPGSRGRVAGLRPELVLTAVSAR